LLPLPKTFIDLSPILQALIDNNSASRIPVSESNVNTALWISGILSGIASGAGLKFGSRVFLFGKPMNLARLSFI
jgi:hypothetical protein